MKAQSEKDLIKSLRAKFVLVVTGVSALILLVAFSFVCRLDYAQSINSIYNELSVSIENSNVYLQSKAGSSQEEDQSDSSGDGLSDEYPRGPLNAEPPAIGVRSVEAPRIPVALYIVKPPRKITMANEATAWIDDSVLNAALDIARNSEVDQGYIKEYGLYYRTVSLPKKTTLVAFADESSAQEWISLARLLALVGAALLVVVFFLSLLLSRWAVHPMKQAWEAQQQFISDASHELKTPLTVILANASIALKRPESTIGEQSQWIEGIQDEAQHMQHMVLDMLTLARHEETGSSATSASTGDRGTAQDAPAENVNLSDVAEGVALQFEAVAFERGVFVDTDIEPRMFVQGNTNDLQRLASILVDNACKYAQADTTVTVKLHRTSEGIELSVHNWGDAIPPQELEHLFDRFYRADKARNRNSENGSHSFGLGLAIARKIMEEHNGEMSVTSTNDAGTCFTARFK